MGMGDTTKPVKNTDSIGLKPVFFMWVDGAEGMGLISKPFPTQPQQEPI